MHGPAMPDGLAERLRVLASHERERLLLRVNLAARLRNWKERLQLSFDNMMRPLALPFAGGLLSALAIFACIMQTPAFPYYVRNDVPLPMIATDPDGQVVDWVGRAPQLLPVTEDVSSDAIAALLLIDPQGRVADYMVAHGEATREMKNFFLLSRFTPATSFGQPTWGYKLVLFPRTGARS
jgi:PAS domain-containing protein